MQNDTPEQKQVTIESIVRIKDELSHWGVDGNILDNHSGTQRQSSDEEDNTTWQLHKRIKTSKRDIPDYQWSDKREQKLDCFVKANPELYDKKQKDWQNVASKTRLWTKIGEQLDPPASHPQCKKHYENMRTRVGKIMKREKTRGTDPSVRSDRERRIMETWSFLTQHIGRARTFTVPEGQIAAAYSAIYNTSSEDDGENDEEVQSARFQPATRSRSIKGKRKGKQSVSPATQRDTTATSTTPEINPTPIDPIEAIRQVLVNPDVMGASARPSYTGHQRIVHNFACLLEEHMQAVPEDSWHDFQIDCLNLVHRYKQRTNAHH